MWGAWAEGRGCMCVIWVGTKGATRFYLCFSLSRSLLFHFTFYVAQEEKMWVGGGGLKNRKSTYFPMKSSSFLKFGGKEYLVSLCMA